MQILEYSSPANSDPEIVFEYICLIVLFHVFLASGICTTCPTTPAVQFDPLVQLLGLCLVAAVQQEVMLPMPSKTRYVKQFALGRWKNRSVEIIELLWSDSL